MPLSRDPDKRAKQLANLAPAPPPPEPGAQRALRHGGYASVAIDRLEAAEREVYYALSADAPLRGPDGGLPAHDAAAVRLLVTVLCRLENVETYLNAHGYLTDKGQVRPAAELAGRMRREAAEYLDALGMTPRSRAKLGLDLTKSRDLAAEYAIEKEREDPNA